MAKKKRKAGEPPTEFYDARAINPAPPTKREREGNPTKRALILGRASGDESYTRAVKRARKIAKDKKKTVYVDSPGQGEWVIWIPTTAKSGETITSLFGSRYMQTSVGPRSRNPETVEHRSKGRAKNPAPLVRTTINVQTQALVARLLGD
jgi:hypothetical protein